MADVVEVLQRSAGTATFAQLRRSTTGRAIRGALATGSIRRIAKGVYALPTAKNPFTAARAQGGAVSHQSAAVLHGFDLLKLPTTPQVTVPRGQHRRKSSLVCDLHWADDVPVVGQLTTKLQTIIDCARTLPFAESLCIADSALRTNAISKARLVAAAADVGGPGSRRARLVARSADGRAESPLESALRAILIEAGIDGFLPQVVVQDNMFSARLDLAHRELMIALEADSFAHHGTRDALTRDCRRHTNLTIRGWRLLRFSWEDVMFHPEWVAEAVRRAVSADLQAITIGRPRALAAGAARPA